MNTCACNKLCDNSGLFVDITGLCNLEDVNSLDANPYWTQISVPTVFTLPEQKPDMEQLDSENITVEILRKKVIVTPTPVSTTFTGYVYNREGKIDTGRKLVIDGLICKSITYTAVDDVQSVHSAHASVPFSAYIVLPQTITVNNVVRDPLFLNFEIISCVEDVFIKEICNRQIFQNITLFLQAVPAPLGCNETDCDAVDNVLIKGISSRDDLAAIELGDDEDWTQLVLSENLVIPEHKLDIEQINGLVSHIDIISQRVVKTPNSNGGLSLEGTKLTGRKLIIEGILRQKITYTADVATQSVHSVHFDIPFSAFIVVEGDAVGSSVFKVEPYIEDIFICAVDKRQIFKNSVIFIKATKCV